MSTYLARVERDKNEYKDYHNVRPVMELIDGGLVEVDESKFGQYGTINIKINNNDDFSFIQDQKYYIFSISDTELLSLERTNTGLKIRAFDFINKCKSVDGFSIRELITLPSALHVNKFTEWGKEYITDLLPPMTKVVYLSDDKQILGPFNWERTVDNQYKFNPYALTGDPYTVNCYDKTDFHNFIYTFDAAKRYTDPFAGRTRCVLKDDSLHENFTKIDCIGDNELKDFVGKLLAQSAGTKREKNEIKNSIKALPTESITEARKQRILEFVKNGELADQTMNLIPAVLTSDSETIKQIICK